MHLSSHSQEVLITEQLCFDFLDMSNLGVCRTREDTLIWHEGQEDCIDMGTRLSFICHCLLYGRYLLKAIRTEGSPCPCPTVCGSSLYSLLHGNELLCSYPLTFQISSSNSSLTLNSSLSAHTQPPIFCSCPSHSLTSSNSLFSGTSRPHPFCCL